VLIPQLPVFKGQLSGNKQQVSCANRGLIAADGLWRCREFQSELLKLQRNVHRRWSFLVALLRDGSERHSVFSFARSALSDGPLCRWSTVHLIAANSCAENSFDAVQVQRRTRSCVR